MICAFRRSTVVRDLRRTAPVAVPGILSAEGRGWRGGFAAHGRRAKTDCAGFCLRDLRRGGKHPPADSPGERHPEGGIRLHRHAPSDLRRAFSRGASRRSPIGSIRTASETSWRCAATRRRGPPASPQAPDGLRYASELIRLLKERHADFCLGVGRLSGKASGGRQRGFGSGQPEAKARIRRRLRDHAALLRQRRSTTASSIAAGGRESRRQLCPDSCRSSRSSRSSASPRSAGPRFPPTLLRRLEAAGEAPEIVEAVGIDWALGQIRDLLAHGAPGYHLYILNRSKGALALAAGLAA